MNSLNEHIAGSKDAVDRYIHFHCILISLNTLKELILYFKGLRNDFYAYYYLKTRFRHEIDANSSCVVQKYIITLEKDNNNIEKFNNALMGIYQPYKCSLEEIITLLLNDLRLMRIGEL